MILPQPLTYTTRNWTKSDQPLLFQRTKSKDTNQKSAKYTYWTDLWGGPPSTYDHLDQKFPITEKISEGPGERIESIQMILQYYPQLIISPWAAICATTYEGPFLSSPFPIGPVEDKGRLFGGNIKLRWRRGGSHLGT